jgi:hypothetical protein
LGVFSRMGKTVQCFGVGRVEIEPVSAWTTARVSERLRRGLQILLPGFKSQSVLFSKKYCFDFVLTRSLDSERQIGLSYHIDIV